MIDTPQVIQTSARPAAVIRLTIPRTEVQRVMGPAMAELASTLAAQGMAPAGPMFTHHLGMDPEVFNFEVGVPVASPIAAAGRVQPGELPAAQVARTVYHGPYEGLAAAWGEFDTWIAAQGLTPAPDLWECYATGPESGADPAAWCTELNRPLVAGARP